MAKLPIKLLPLLGIALLLTAIGFFMMRSGGEDPEELIPEEVSPAEDFSSKNFEAIQLDPDKGVTWELKAEEAGGSLKEGIGRFKKFRIKLHAEDGLDFDLEGNSGEINRIKDEIIFSGDLKGKTSNGYMVYTEQLLLNDKEGTIKSDDTVTFVGPFFTMTGKGLFMDLNKETLELLKDINSTIDIESLNL